MAVSRRGLLLSIVVGVTLVAALIFLYMYATAGKTESAYPTQPESVAYGDKPEATDCSCL